MPSPNIAPFSAPEPHALVPLTVFDNMLERTTFVTGWLVEGSVDPTALAEALKHVADKWRFLAGRVQSLKEENSPTTKWYIRVPLGPLPEDDYPTFRVTTATAPKPLSSYVSLPIPLSSTSLPPELFVHPSTPRQYKTWESASCPLTCWHLTTFPSEEGDDREEGGKGEGEEEGRERRLKNYTAIGFARSHGVFDGLGAAMVVKAVVAELNGKEWTVPPLPSPGLNTNPLVDVLETELAKTREEGKVLVDYRGYSLLGISGYLKLVVYHLKEKWWGGAERRTVLVPKPALDYLVDSVRTALKNEGKEANQVSSGDILVAWIFKTVYSKGISGNATVHCTNVAAFRTLLSDSKDPTNPITSYVQNAFCPIPYPLFSASDIQSFSLPRLTSLLTASRLSLTKDHIISAYRLVKTPTIMFPSHPEADDDLMISNVSASRILEADWSGIGAKGTVCGYRYQLTPTDVLFTNAVFIAGRLGDGTVVLDVSLNRARLERFVEEVEKAVGAAASVASNGTNGKAH